MPPKFQITFRLVLARATCSENKNCVTIMNRTAPLYGLLYRTCLITLAGSEILGNPSGIQVTRNQHHLYRMAIPESVREPNKTAGELKLLFMMD
jgi:hypothetical protein